MKKEENKSTEGAKGEVSLREEEMLAFWNEHDIFNKSLEKDAPHGDFIFYDGPPFATGTPHYGHILAGTIKDAIPRFWTMNGYHVPRKWGWDCHGLPLENIIEKRLGLATKRDIEELGVKKFNEAARSAVLEYADDWKKVVPRMGRFVDMEHDYRTMDPTYTESVWWVFSELHKKGLVYEGFKSMHLCPRCGTTLSNFEVNQGYKDIKDISVTVKLPLVDEPGTSLLVWTTTPWTLPGNLAAAVHNDIVYVKVRVTLEEKEEVVILAKDRLVQLGTDGYEIVSEMNGSELVGRSYIPPFDHLKKLDIPNADRAWKIYHADYVELGEEGTGAVHIAPAYGEEDMELAKLHGIPIFHHVGLDGRFRACVTDYAGQLAKPKDDDGAGVTHLDADIEIVKALKQSGRLFQKQNITHSYPHCWRCDTPLLNYATTSWFVKVTNIKEQLVAENNKVHWVPEHVGRARFGNWLEGARDWAVSRQRYWGAPIPIWRNPKAETYMVIGSLADLKQHVHKSGNRYFLMRHGESESNRAEVTSTKVAHKSPLTETGKKQVATAVESLKGQGIDLIIASPFERTRETAELVRDALELPHEALIFDERIGEVHLGEMDGVSNTEYRRFLLENGGWQSARPPGGESWTDVRDRVGAFLYDINRAYAHKNILIVSHNAPLRMLGVVNDGDTLLGKDFDHDEEGKRFLNAEVRPLPFTPLPHNVHFELDYHRPYIDEIELFDTDGTKLERVPDVFDCWFESGSMPYGQQHYPFRGADVFDPKNGKGYPAHFIAEGLDQTRGWFYSLLVLGTALFGKSPYQNVIVNGLILAEDGRKMSKSLQNYPDPMELADRIGADAIRYYLLSSPIVRGEDLNFSEKEVLELQRKNIGRLHNVLAMYEMYADAAVGVGSDSPQVLDRWMIARLHETTKMITEGYRAYELDRATRPIADLIDDISVWYLRRSRDRLKGDDVEDRNHALATLRYTLRTLALLMAPVMPFYAEYLYQRVKENNDPESVHLAEWPLGGEVAEYLIADMAEARRITSLALEARQKANVKVRQPLALLKYRIDSPSIKYLHEIIESQVRDEINVKRVEFDSSIQEDVYLDTTITPELKREGDVRELMRAIQDVRKTLGLDPHDRIELLVSGETKRRMEGFESMVTAVVGAERMTESTVGTRSLDLDNVTYSFDVVKL